MGVYNPHIPRILGQEFCPIRDEGVTFSPSVNAVELGHRFVLGAPLQIRDARFYVNTLPPGYEGNQIYMASVYPAGLEDETGPINSVIIPCNNAASSGTVNAGIGLVASLSSPGDVNTVSATPYLDVNSKAVEMWFATNSYAPLLTGKRIVGVNFLYTLSWDPTNAANEPASNKIVFQWQQSLVLKTGTGTVLRAGYAPHDGTYGNDLQNLPDMVIGNPGAVTQIGKVEFGDVNLFWSTPSVATTSDRMPWRYQELQRFEQSAANRYSVIIDFGGTNATDWAGIYYLGYAALEVLYCEEQRVAYGGASFGAAGGILTSTNYILGANILTLRDTSFNATPTLPIGDYSVVVESSNIGDLNGPANINSLTRPADSNTYPTLNAVRELYELPSHEGVQVNLSQTVGETFTRQSTLVLPQISIHNSSGPLVEPHVYGRQAVAQVYGTLTATQEVKDTGLSAASYPQVRFYARRFGTTTVPLTLSSPTVTGSGVSVSITPAQWDALDPIIDGWKEVTLRFPVAPVMGTGLNPQWIWSSAGELKGNRWEVLGTTAPAISGTPGNNMNLVPAPDQLTTATYGQPATGATINMGWVPQYAPPVSATVDDQTSDAVIYFAQDAPAVTGFSVIQLNQAISGIGQNCNLNPAFIPSQLAYNQLSWGLDQLNIVNDTFTRTVCSGWGSATPSGQLWQTSGGSATDFNVNCTAQTTFTDTFTRVVANGWGSADTGQAWSIAEGSPTSDFFVNGTVGVQSHSAIANKSTTVNLGTPNQDITAMFRIPVAPTGGTAAAIIDLRLRYTDANNFYYVRIITNAAGVMTFEISKAVAGVGSLLASGTSLTLNITHTYGIRLSVLGSVLQAKFWDDTASGGLQPAYFQISATDSSLTTGNNLTIFSIPLNVTNTLPFVYNFDNITNNLSPVSSAGTVYLSTTGTYRIARLSNVFNVQNVDGYVEISSNQAAVSLDHWGSLGIRDTGGDQWYAEIKFNPTGTVQLVLTSLTGVTHTVLGTVTIANSYVLNTKVKLRIQASGAEFRGKAWMDGEMEPVDWLLRVAIYANNNPGTVSTRSVAGAGAPTISYDNLLVSNTTNGYTEIQRMDPLTDWQTIMKAYRQDVNFFNDYEARIGLLSSYRIRYVDFYGFAGPWSATISNTIAAPGVTATAVGANDHVWVFTTNAQQSGASNLAYCLAWSGDVSEDFNFPESSGQVFQTLYGRDDVTVFRPSERGGTNFSRNLLVQAAAISPETLEDFTSLRNMAWADVPYICLRDEDGNRWFANVSVPSGTVLHDRKLYMAPVTVVEVTTTAAPVSP